VELLQTMAIANLANKGLIVSRVKTIPHAQHVQQGGTTMILGKHHACPVKPERPTTLPTQAARIVHLAKNPALVACAKPRVQIIVFPALGTSAALVVTASIITTPFAQHVRQGG